MTSTSEPTGIIRTRRAAAAALGVTERTLARWPREPWWPADGVETTRSGRNVNWNIDRIRAAVHAQGRKGSELDDEAKALLIRKQRLQVEQLELETRKALRAEAEAVGNVLPRDELTASVRECIVIARDRFLSLPKVLAKLVPLKHRRKLLAEGDREVRRILNALADMLQQTAE